MHAITSHPKADARPGEAARSAAGLLQRLSEALLRHRMRSAAAKLDDRALKDVGLVRSDIDAACGRALSASAASEVAGASFLRAGNW